MKVDLSKVTLEKINPQNIKSYGQLVDKAKTFTPSKYIDYSKGLDDIPSQFGLTLNRWNTVGIKAVNGNGKPFSVFARLGSVSLFYKKEDKHFFDAMGIKSDYVIVYYKRNKEVESTKQFPTFSHAWAEFVRETKKLCK